MVTASPKKIHRKDSDSRVNTDIDFVLTNSNILPIFQTERQSNKPREIKLSKLIIEKMAESERK